MSSVSSEHFWLSIHGHSVGPFSIVHIHEKLATGEISWQTLACEVGDDRWMPIVEQSRLGPPRTSRDESVRPRRSMPLNPVERYPPAPANNLTRKGYPAIRQFFHALLIATFSSR